MRIRVLGAIVTKKLHGAEHPAAVHAAAGDALVSLSADVSSVAASHSSATQIVAGARGDTPREFDPFLVTTLSASRMRLPTR